MGFEAVEPEQRQLLKKALEDARLTVPEVWMKYFSIGGAAGEYEIDAYINGSLSLPPFQRDILAHAANELIDQLPARPRAPYSAEVAQRRAGDGRDANGLENDPSRRHRRNAGED
ncbi:MULTISPECIES: hypothetical protein [Arthrobacter]|uniref:Uncharacterized protein n=1 Tax=Arthrobacter jinronghuae TaxID=2964609 RepID=A0ABT1NXL8_9MICC|nr:MULTISPECIES: hypothetical protein [Arthrobacter]MCQ1951249.1 hypothetical protein [Arthrobacter jinronghuae]MCQ1954586.1 hypothetical protein [Arthrobacter sp. zg-Y238]